MPSSTFVPPLILASGSRYRRELLARLRRPFESIAPDVDERALDGESPRDTALRLARAKARAVAAMRPDAVVIGSDQVAECEGRSLGKPGGFDAARAQLRFLSGRVARFHTALCVVRSATIVDDDVVTTEVRFRALDDAVIERYLRLEEPYDCAGSAKSEALGIALLASVESDDPTALVGLPLIRLVTMLDAAGLAVLAVR